MTELNTRKLTVLLGKLDTKSIVVKYGNLPFVCELTIDKAAVLKREKKYDESLSCYLQAVEQHGGITSEMGRMMAKTLCAMNEYIPAIILLIHCANAKWEDVVKAPEVLYMTSPELAKSMEQVIPTASAADFIELSNCIKQAAYGNLKPLFERTKAVSGQANYQNVKSDNEIVTQAKHLVREMNM